jgi:hypothetical protein
MEIVEKFREIDIQYLDSLTQDELCSYMKSKLPVSEKRKLYNQIKILCKQNIKAKYEIKRLYTHSFKHQDKHEGRLFDGSSIQGIPKTIRGFLCKGLTTDIDQNNSHPTILKYLCDKHNIKHYFYALLIKINYSVKKKMISLKHLIKKQK